MPTSSNAREEQRNAQIFSVLFWIGVGLAPVAALLLLVGSGTGSLRAAVGILIISVILVGVSITLGRESQAMKTEIEDSMFDEIDSVRGEIRDDIGHAVQATHRALGEKMQYLLDQVEATRAELEATKAQLETLRHQPVPAAAQRGGAPMQGGGQHGQRQGMPPGVLRHTETVQVTTRHTVVDPHEESSRGTTYGARQPITARGGAQPYRERDDYREDRRERDEYRDDRRERDSGYRDREESWTDQRLRDQLDRQRDVSEPAAVVDRWQREPYEDRWSGSVIDEDDDRRPAVRTGDRYASVRNDDNGRELRIGERRAGVFSDGRGTEVRIEDRWAAVRREAGLDRPRWEDDDRLDAPRDFPYRDRERRAISSSDREDRWSDQRDYDRDHDRDHRYR